MLVWTLTTWTGRTRRASLDTVVDSQYSPAAQTVSGPACDDAAAMGPTQLVILAQHTADR